MATSKWLSDIAHSEIEFKVRHLMITTITGHFRKFDLEVETEEEDFTKASRIIFTVGVDSIDTNNEQRDTHLKAADFFSVAEYPQLLFEGTGNPGCGFYWYCSGCVRTNQSRFHSGWQDQTQGIWPHLGCSNRSRAGGSK
jgi:hypothetical protein